VRDREEKEISDLLLTSLAQQSLCFHIYYYCKRREKKKRKTEKREEGNTAPNVQCAPARVQRDSSIFDAIAAAAARRARALA
jgi:hypothetical protein